MHVTMNVFKIIAKREINTIEVIIHELQTELPVDVHRERCEEKKWKTKVNIW